MVPTLSRRRRVAAAMAAGAFSAGAAIAGPAITAGASVGAADGQAPTAGSSDPTTVTTTCTTGLTIVLSGPFSATSVPCAQPGGSTAPVSTTWPSAGDLGHGHHRLDWVP